MSRKSHSLKGTGCLSYAQAGKPQIYLTPEEKEFAWCDRLKKDMERAVEYFWRQTAERRVIQRNFLRMKERGFCNFSFGNRSC